MAIESLKIFHWAKLGQIVEETHLLENWSLNYSGHLAVMNSYLHSILPWIPRETLPPRSALNRK